MQPPRRGAPPLGARAAQDGRGQGPPRPRRAIKPDLGGEGAVAAAKIKVIELAKELGVTSKDLILASEEMGQKGVRAMTPLDTTLANNLRVKLGKGRELPEEPKPKRPVRAKVAPADGGVGTKTAARSRKKVSGEDEAAQVELKPAATIVKPKPAPIAPEGQPEVLEVPTPVAEIATEPKPIVPPPTPEDESQVAPTPKPIVTPLAPPVPPATR